MGEFLLYLTTSEHVFVHRVEYITTWELSIFLSSIHGIFNIFVKIGSEMHESGKVYFFWTAVDGRRSFTSYDLRLLLPK